jgi:hypothetical protein
MSELKIIVEGPTDKKFISDYILYAFGVSLSENDFIVAKGNLLREPAKANTIQKNTIAGGINILIFDADSDIDKTKKRVDSEISEYNLEIQSQFFFPNDKQTGNLETLLKEIINPDRAGIIECIENYGECIKAHGIPELKKHDDKRLFYLYDLYFDTFLVKDDLGKKKQPKDYHEPLLWNLDAEYLQPLYNFLKIHFLKPKLE